MSTTVDHDDLMTRLRMADPVDLEELERAVAPRRAELKRRAIDAGSTPSEPIPAGDRIAVEAGAAPRGRRPSSLPRRWLSLGFASLGCAAVLAAVIIFSGGSIDAVRREADPSYADAAVKVAEANPRLLVTAPGWRIVEAKSFKVKVGTLIFGDGQHQIRLFWLPSVFRHEMNANAGPGTSPATISTVLGREVQTRTFTGPGGFNYFSTSFPPEAGIFVTLEGAFANEGEWESILSSLRSVSVDAWLAAMPADVIQPDALPAEISRMLHGVTVPPGFDAAMAIDENELTNRYQTAKKLTQAVTCGWVDRWTSARMDGDHGVAQEAVAAMAGAGHWPVLLQMIREKGYRGDTLPTSGHLWPTSILTIARQMAAGNLEREKVFTKSHGKVTSVHFEIPKGAYPPSAVNCSPVPRG